MRAVEGTIPRGGEIEPEPVKRWGVTNGRGRRSAADVSAAGMGSEGGATSGKALFGGVVEVGGGGERRDTVLLTILLTREKSDGASSARNAEEADVVGAGTF